MTVLDIQVKEEFDRHHIRGAVATYAYPVKSGEEKARIASVYASLIDGSGSVIIVCPRGGGGAKRTCDYLVSRGIEAQRLLILENGQGGWPYPEMLEGAK
jgi:thiosulfate/3-mercaptopyruvate sulfurtransferase